jgi:hypothetical protein
MQVNNNLATINNPNFTAIKSIKYEGLYKNRPDLCRKMINTLSENQEAMGFFKKYDVDITFNAFKEGCNNVVSEINIFFDNITKGKVKKFFQSLTNNEDKVKLSAYQSYCEVTKGLEDGTEELISYISPVKAGNNSTGVLASNLKFEDERMQNILREREMKKSLKFASKVEADVNKQRTETDADNLANSIEELIDKSKEDIWQ